jgi:hypothetical protein
MSEHRFRELLNPTPNLFGPAPLGAFVSCPMFPSFSGAHQTQIQEIYRIAAERTREQLRPRPSRIPQFSLN